MPLGVDVVMVFSEMYLLLFPVLEVLFAVLDSGLVSFPAQATHPSVLVEVFYLLSRSHIEELLDNLYRE